jgi:hypothetical protein
MSEDRGLSLGPDVRKMLATVMQLEETVALNWDLFSKTA